MDIENMLKEVGLTERESKVYTALLELGLTTTGPVIKKSGVPNSKIYEIMESLQNKGLVSWIIRGKTKYFQAAHPRKLLTLFEEKKRSFEQTLPELEHLIKKARERSSVELFERTKSIRNMFIDIISNLKPQEKWYGYATGESSTNEKIRLFYEWLGELKRQYKVRDHLLISEKHREGFKKTHKKRGEFWKVKFSKVSFPGDVGIYKDKVILLNWDDTPIAILITNKALAKQYFDFFMSAWENAKP